MTAREMALSAARQAMLDHGLALDVAIRHGVIDALMRIYFNRRAPRIISGFRSPAKQRELLQRWNAGDPGVAFEPARQSWHLSGRALDLAHRDEWYAKAWVALGGRDGAQFGDDNHFDVPDARVGVPSAW